MSGKIRQRGLLAIIIYFMMITAIWAPIGYYAGRARGETQAQAISGIGKDLSHLETQSLAPDGGETNPHFYAPIVFLPGQTEPIRTASSQSHAPQAVRRDATLRQNPLREAVLRALANDAAAGGASEDGTSSQPFSLAMAPDPSAMSGGVTDLTGLGGGVGAGIGGGATTPSGGYPGAIIPGFLAAAPPPGGEPPVLTTPIPAALPMFLSGLAACWAAVRRKRTR